MLGVETIAHMSVGMPMQDSFGLCLETSLHKMGLGFTGFGSLLRAHKKV